MKDKTTGLISLKQYNFLKQFSKALTEEERQKIKDFEESRNPIVPIATVEVKEVKPVNIDYNMLRSLFLYNFQQVTKRCFTISENEKDFYRELLWYFSKDERFGSSNIEKTGHPSFDKGIMIVGVPGVGKSTFFEVMKEVCKDLNYHSSLWFNSYSLVDITNSYKSFSNENDRYDLFDKLKKGTKYFDDLGSESKYFGEYIFNEIFQARYNNKCKTYITTNDSLAVLDEKYGTRFQDRLKEKMNIFIHPRRESFRGSF